MPIKFVGNINTSIAAGKEEGANWVYVTTPGSPAFTFNTAEPPFDDVRVRRAFIQAVDREQMAELIGADSAIDNWTLEESPYYTPEATIPPYDPDAAQALFDEVRRSRAARSASRSVDRSRASTCGERSSSRHS